MVRAYKRGRGKGFPKASKISPRPTRKEREEIRDAVTDLDKLCEKFDVDDLDDIEDIVSGRIGEAEW